MLFPYALFPVVFPCSPYGSLVPKVLSVVLGGMVPQDRQATCTVLGRLRFRGLLPL